MKRLVAGLVSVVVLGWLAGSAFAATGGPDGFGYTFIDNNSPGGPTFTYESITATGTLSTQTNCDDCVQLAVPFGFTFNFYGMNYTSAGLSTNGFLRFDSSSSSQCCDDHGNIPSTELDVPAIFLMWNDLDPSECGDLYYQTKGSAPSRRFIVEWDSCHNNSPTSSTACKATFEMILFETTNHILFQYLDTTFSPTGGTCNSAGSHGGDQGDDASVGIQQDSSVGLEYSEDGSRLLTAGLAVCFVPPNSSAGPCGALPPTATPTTTATATATSLPERPRVNVSGGVAPLALAAQQAQENRDRVATAAAPAPVQATIAPPRTGTGITPPNTGDAGLRSGSSALLPTLLVAGTVAGALGLASLRSKHVAGR